MKTTYFKMKAFKEWFWRTCPSHKYSWAGVFLTGGIFALAFFGAFDSYLMTPSNSLEFCVSCHEMESKPYKEYKKTAHFSNHTGVQASCADCHVPKEWGGKIFRKILAGGDLYHTVIGSVDTPVKFEAKRLQLAQRVWASMKERDSKECRNCHKADTMKLEDQSRPARKKHAKAAKNGETCIDCHKGLVHELPKGYEDI